MLLDSRKSRKEVHSFQVSHHVPSPFDQHNAPVPLDEWWAAVASLKKFPLLCKMAFALMSCFHGPHVEGSFNVMGDVLCPKSGRMLVQTYSAIQTVKYGLRATGKSALELYSRKDPKHEPVDVKLCHNLRTARKQYANEQAASRAIIEDKRKRLALAKPIESNQAAKRKLAFVQSVAKKAHKMKHQQQKKSGN